MKRFLTVLTVLLTTHAYCQEQDILPRPPRPIERDSELALLIRSTRVGEARFYKNLVVFPLYTSGVAAHGYWTLDDAMAKGLVRIAEKGGGSVPDLLVENLSDEPVFLLAGEIVAGGKQNRVISQDILLPPRSGLINVGVYCVEHGRWTQRSHYFSAESSLAHSQLRGQLSAPLVTQSGVWGEVARKAEAVAPGAAAGTGYVGDVYEDRQVKREVDDYARAVSVPSDANGMAVVIAGRVVGVEIFGDCETFAKLRDKLMRSYAMDAIECVPWDKPAIEPGVVERFLRRAGNARLVAKRTIGIGRLLGIQGEGLYGTVLTWHEQNAAHGVVHASIFEEARPADIKPHPPIVPFERE